MTHLRSICSLLTISLGAAALGGCGDPASDGSDNPVTGGSWGTGGALSTGGSQAAVGGSSTTGTGGNSSVVSTGGGLIGTGGAVPSTGGVTGNSGGDTGNTGGWLSNTGGRGNTGGGPSTGGRGNTGGGPSTGGRGNTGGGPSTGGRGNTGGTAGSGGRGNTGGIPDDTGGTPGDTGGTPDNTGGIPGDTGGISGSTGGTPEQGTCSFTIQGSASTAISTVGIVEWSTTLAGATSASIQFGPTTSYGLVAPVDTVGASNRTLLLGNKPGTAVNYKIVATNGTTSCESDNQTFQTGQPPTSNLKPSDISTNNAAARIGGFKVTTSYTGGYAFIMDVDGDPVWWYQMGSGGMGMGGKQPTRALMSYDGQYMWVAHANVPSGGAAVHRVSMDGLEAEDLSQQFADLNHDFTVLPDETVAYEAYVSGNGNCDRVMERSPSGQVKTVVADVCQLLGVSSTHLNGIHYDASDDTLVFSTLNSDSITKVDRDGNEIWTVGGTPATLPGASWDNQHGFHILSSEELLIFNNGATGMGGGSGSKALQVLLDLGANTSSTGWSYNANPSIANTVMGDVQRLANGNTLVTYSTKGIVHEVDANGTLVEELAWSLGGVLGYMQQRETLYGPPPM